MQSVNRIMDELSPLLGVEQALDHVNHVLKNAAASFNASVVGAMQIMCSDEAEHETAESFQRCFTQDLLPRLKHGQRTPFRTASLGGRYDWGSVRVAEGNFASALSGDDYKLILLRISAHCAIHREDGVTTYGHLRRYGRESYACGALNGLLLGSALPFADKLRYQFLSEGNDRITTLREQTPENIRALYAAVVSARMQARSAAVDAQDHTPATPTLYVIVHSVTLNKVDRDTELVGGLYIIDRRGGQHHDQYCGIGDDPTAYRMHEKHSLVHVTDDTMTQRRAARDHRKLITPAQCILPTDPRVCSVLRHADHDDDAAIRAAAQTLLLLLAESAPIAAALLLFAKGPAGAYNVYRAHRIAGNIHAVADAREILMALHDRLDHMPPHRAREIVDVLRAAYTPATI